jgi:hypothetical protein
MVDARAFSLEPLFDGSQIYTKKKRVGLDENHLLSQFVGKTVHNYEMQKC